MNRTATFIPDADDIALTHPRSDQQPFGSHYEPLMLAPLLILPLPSPYGWSAVAPVCSALLSHRDRGGVRGKVTRAQQTPRACAQE